jgi:putative ABC transport system permease protein
MFKLFDIFAYTLERLWEHRLLVLWVLVGLVVATTLALSLPLYVDSVYSDLLSSRLTTPPYAYKIRYLGAWEGNISAADVASADSAVRGGFTPSIGFPVEREATFIRIGTWNRALEDGTRFGTVDVGALEGAEDQMVISRGEWSDDVQTEDGAIPLLIPEIMFYTSGIEIGTKLTLQLSRAEPVEGQVVAMWRAASPNDPSWIFTPKFFDEVILVRPDDLWNMVEGVDEPVTEAAWYVVFDESSIRTADVDALLANTTRGLKIVETVLPGIRPETPEAGLKAFNDEVTRFTLQLFIIIAPVGGLVLYFVSMVAGLLVSRQGPEDVKLSSRGMSRRGILGIHFLMWFGMAGLAFVIGIALSPYVVRLVGQTISFLRFDASASSLQITFTTEALAAGALTGLIAASSGLFLAWRSTRQNVNSLRQMDARARRAWWQRAYLDLMLLVPALYVLYTLNQRGGLVAAADSPFSDPLTFSGPTLFALGMTLLFLRVFPFLLGFSARLLTYTNSIAILMAFREITRSIGRYRGTLLMMAFTLSLTGFTASMASTLDRSLEDTLRYRIGADLVLVTAIDALTEQEQDSETGETSTTVTGFNAPPVGELYDIEGVETVSRVGRYPARLVTGGRNRLDGVVLGVDRWAIAAVTPFRHDFASQPLADLMNKLATRRTGIIISRQTMIDNNLAIGQELQLEVQALNEWYPMTVPILDVIDYFPTLDPREHPFFAITNLEPIFEAVGTPLPFNVWMGLETGADRAAVEASVREIGFPVVRWQDPQSALALAQAEPGRRGVLGFLSIGFVAAIALTLIATVIQNTASYRAQARQLGALQAMGLGGSTVSGYMLLLQGTAAGGSILCGTGIGALTTLLFLPLLDFSGGLPPYLVRVAWDQILLVYGAFAGAFILVTLLTTLSLSRQQLATVVRLGEI